METKENKRKQPIILITLDGFGVGPMTGANIFNARVAPKLSAIIESYPCARLIAKASLFGWPERKIITPDIGHLALNAGAPCVFGQEAIEAEIKSGVLFKDKLLSVAIKQAKQYDSAWHLLGSADDESSAVNLKALADYAKRKKINRIFVNQATEIKDNDVIIFYSAYPNAAVGAFDFKKHSGLLSLSLIKIDSRLPVKVIGEPVRQPGLSLILAKHKLRQLIIAEAEGALAACYYGNGLATEPVVGQDWQIVNSATDIIDLAVQAINSRQYDFMTINLPALINVSGVKAMTERLIESDKLLAKLTKTALVGDNLIFLTSCCSGSESALDLISGEDNKLKVDNDVPFVIIGSHLEGNSLRPDISGGDLSLLPVTGSLLDVAPTILKHFDLEQPKWMKGIGLF